MFHFSRYIFQFYTMLKKWPIDELTLTTVLQLLNCQYPDTRVRTLAVYTRVRTLAVWCLDKQITDQLLELFMLQLVQVKYFKW